MGGTVTTAIGPVKKQDMRRMAKTFTFGLERIAVLTNETDKERIEHDGLLVSRSLLALRKGIK